MKISGSLLFRSKAFWSVVAISVIANLWSWAREWLSPGCCDGETTVGFPFPFRIADTIAASAEFYPLGLLLDLVVTLTVAVIATRIALIGGAD